MAEGIELNELGLKLFLDFLFNFLLRIFKANKTEISCCRLYVLVDVSIDCDIM